MTYRYRICFETNEPQTPQAMAMQYAFQNVQESGIANVLAQLGLPAIENPDIVLDEIVIEHESELSHEEALACAQAQPGFIKFSSWDLIA